MARIGQQARVRPHPLESVTGPTNFIMCLGNPGGGKYLVHEDSDAEVQSYRCLLGCRRLEASGRLKEGFGGIVVHFWAVAVRRLSYSSRSRTKVPSHGSHLVLYVGSFAGPPGFSMDRAAAAWELGVSIQSATTQTVVRRIETTDSDLVVSADEAWQQHRNHMHCIASCKVARPPLIHSPGDKVDSENEIATYLISRL